MPACRNSKTAVVKRYGFRLFVTGATGKSSRAITNLTQVCERYIAGEYVLDVVDIYQQPELARGQQIVAAPTLVKYSPLPLRRFIGDLSKTRELLKALEIQEE
jgi:circadian clock protein KaiB